MGPIAGTARLGNRLGPALGAALLVLGCGTQTRQSPGSPDSGDTDTFVSFQPVDRGFVPGWRLAWATQVAGDGDQTVPLQSNMAKDLEISPDGSFIFTGHLYSESVVFGPGTENEITLHPYDDGAIFLARYTPDGVPVWVKTVRDDLFEGCNVEILPDGIVLFSGRAMGGQKHPPIVFGMGEPKETSFIRRCMACPFLASCHPDGSFDRVTIAEWPDGSDPQEAEALAWGLASFPDGSSCMALWLECPLDFPSEGGTLGLVPEGASDGFLVRFDPQGLARWARRIGGAGEDGSWGVDALSDGSCVVGGWYEDNVTAEGGAAADVTLDGGAPFGEYAARYSAEGDLAWAIDLTVRAPEEWRGQYISVHPLLLRNGDIAVAGQFAGTIDLGNGQVAKGTEYLSQVFLSRLSDSGERLWTTAAVGPGGEGDMATGAWSVAELENGGLVVGGVFSGEKTFGPGETAETTLTASGREDGFLAMYEPDGALAWAFRLGGSSVWGLTDGILAVATVGNDTIYAAGYFEGTPTIGDTGQNMGISTSGGIDVLLMRLDRNKAPN
jgi:hypothetical protein